MSENHLTPIRAGLIFLAVILFSGILQASVIQGVISSQKGEPLAFANIYIKNSTIGVTSDLKGRYFFEVNPGTYTLVYSYVGYEKVEKNITIKKGERKTLNASLIPESTALASIDIVTKYEDRSREIMKKTRQKRKIYLSALNDYQCKTYIKTSLEKETETVSIEIDDSLSEEDPFMEQPQIDFQTHIEKEKLNILETISTTYFKRPGKYKEHIDAQHDYVEKKGEIGGRSASIGISYGEEDIAPTQNRDDNPYMLYKDITSCEFNFYKNQIDFPSLCQKPLLSPLAASGDLSYRYRLAEAFMDDDKKVYKIEVDPILNNEALFYGFIYIEDSSWILRSVDLQVNKNAMLLCRDFKIIQNYELGEDSIPLAVRREMNYTIKDGKTLIMGNTRVNHSDYVVNSGLEDIKFNSEIKSFAIDAFDQDSLFWEESRPLTLKESELEFIRKNDSIANYYTSDAYYAKVDSSFNKINWWWAWLRGYGHRNRAKGTEFFIGGLPRQVKLFAVGGYAHRLPGYLNKEFKNNFLLETRGHLGYGFKNRDIKGKVGLGLTYVPKKFIRTFVEIGDYYDQINNYASIEQAFSRSNYVRTKTIAISQRMEIINGLYGELTFDYSDQDPISELQLSKWSEILFGEINEPVEFVRYKKSELKLELKYRIKQKYVIKKNKKIIIGTDYPEIRFIYRRGIPTLFGSEVNFDYLEISSSYNMTLARFGSSSWSVNAGGFVNKKNLRLLEYKYFRGSDRYFFSSPIYSFQLLDKVLSTPNEFLRGNYIHHFEGTLLNKVPLINRLKLGVAAGAGTLLIPEDSFSHFEMFAGLERVFKIKKQLFRFGVYAVTADNTLNDADFTIKFGIDFYNTYTNKWSY